MKHVLVIIGFAALGVACERNAGPKGNPAAQAPQGLPGAGGANPHAGLDMGGAGGMGGANPHAGLDMGGAGGVAAGGMGGAGMTPQPGPLDPSTTLEGTIEASAALADKVKPGDVIFISAKAVDDKGEIVKGPPLAVDRLVVDKLPLAFTLSNQNQMMAGTQLAGPIAIVARVDRDSDAMTRAAGDIEGVVKTTPPQKGLKLVLDAEVE
jgi:hypothetical protein